MFAALIQLGLMGFLPESPRWRVARGRGSEQEAAGRAPGCCEAFAGETLSCTWIQERRQHTPDLSCFHVRPSPICRLALQGKLQEAEAVMKTIATVPPTVDPLNEETRRAHDEVRFVLRRWGLQEASPPVPHFGTNRRIPFRALIPLVATCP